MDCADQSVDGLGLLALLDGPVITEDAAPRMLIRLRLAWHGGQTQPKCWPAKSRRVNAPEPVTRWASQAPQSYRPFT